MLTGATWQIARHLRRGQLVVLESTSYPGTTREVLLPILESGGLRGGEDFHLAMSPERIDPGRTDYTVRTTPKVVGGLTDACRDRAIELYSGCVGACWSRSRPATPPSSRSCSRTSSARSTSRS